jgi:predicted CoA-binding protein
MKKTVVLGASPKPDRYSFIATQKLKTHGHDVVPIGNAAGSILGTEIINTTPPQEGVDTVTLYLNPQRQAEYYDYIFSLHPKRLIFNPGTENDELAEMAKGHNIEVLEACTLVLLSTGQY